MSDQIVALLSNLISIFGTLAGIVLGVVLTNFATRKSERAKLRREKIEEIYALTIQVHNWAIYHRLKLLDTLAENSEDDVDCPIDKMNMLINLYIPSLAEDFTVYYQFVVAIEDIPQLEGRYKGNAREKLIKTTFKGFERQHFILQESLKKLALGSKKSL